MEAPRSGTISADKLCELTGLTDRRHRQLAKDGWFPPPYRGQYDDAKTLAGLFKYFREQIAKKDDSEKTEKTRLAKVKRETAEEELAILRDQYVSKDEIEPALRNVSFHQRAVLQRKFETELAPNLAGLNTQQIRQRIAAAVDEICAVFRDGVRAWLKKSPP